MYVLIIASETNLSTFSDQYLDHCQFDQDRMEDRSNLVMLPSQ